MNAWFWIMLQCTSEGVYIHFPSRKLKLSNLDLNIYLPALNLLNAFLSTKDESLKAQGPLYNTSASSLNNSLKTCATIPKHFSKFWGCFPSWSPFDVLAHFLSWRCSCITFIFLPGANMRSYVKHNRTLCAGKGIIPMHMCSCIPPFLAHW